MATGLSIKETNQQTINQAIQEVQQGHLNCTGTVTLNVSATTTTVTGTTISPSSVILLIPLSADAAASVTTNWISDVIAGEFTINHASNANVDRTYAWVAIG